MSDQNTFALIIRELLRERGMTQKTLSELSNIPRSTLARILSNESDPSFEQMVAIAKVLGVSLDVIAGTISPGKESAPIEVIADNAINTYNELIKKLNDNIEHLTARLADKEALVAAKDEIIALQRSVIESMRSGLNGKCQD